MKSIDERVSRLESLFPNHPLIPGTIISRILKPHPQAGMQWALGFGALCDRKMFFFGDTIEGGDLYQEAQDAKGKSLRQLMIKRLVKDQSELDLKSIWGGDVEGYKNWLGRMDNYNFLKYFMFVEANEYIDG